MKKDLRGTWKQALISILLPILLILIFRWILFEPYIIPSGSMIPTLQIHDHILVKKFAYGVRLPFSEKWLLEWSSIQRDDVIVFKYPKDPNVFYIKRVVGVPGDQVESIEQTIYVNGKMIQGSSQISTEDFEAVIVPEESFFVMGDNRYASSDSRVWGFVPQKNILGKAWIVWLSCEEMLPNAQFLCDPQTMKWDRVLKVIH